MVNAVRFLTSYLSSYLSTQVPLQHLQNESRPHKSVAIIGAGSAGLPMLKTLLDLPSSLREGWEFSLLEEREDVGGVWLPDHNIVSPPDIPETPLYPLLRTNTPVPFMTYPGFPFPPGTPLYPGHTHIQAYHARYAQHYGLSRHIRFNHKLLKAEWTGTSEEGFWNLTISNKDGHLIHESHDHLVVASGRHHIPRIPVWTGQDDWLASSPTDKLKRRIMHSIYYREPEAFTNQSVLVIGNGASGRDTAAQIAKVARETFISVRHDAETVEGVPIKPEISHFTKDGIVFVDGTITDPDVVLLGTGYELRKPFLEQGGGLRTDRSARDNSSTTDGLVTNLRYIFPLYRHILSLSPEYPPNALAFIGLPTSIANCPSDLAQSLFAAHAIVQPQILPHRTVLLEELAVQEENTRASGIDPYTNGHKMLNGTSNEYQDELVEFLKDKGVLPQDGKKFVEQWRRDILTYQYLKRGWKHIEELGRGEEWTRRVKTEAQWADVMRRINDWQRRWEDANGIAFRLELDLAG